MKTFRVAIVKSFLVDIVAENEEKAKQYSEFFTGDVQDISSLRNRQIYDFEITNIECADNEAVNCEEKAGS